MSDMEGDTKENAWNTLRWRSGSIDIIKEGLTEKKTKKSSGSIGLWALSVMVFYAVNGGAFGIEDIVAAGGPYFALVGFVLLFVWAVPEALVTAELSTAIPEASGSVSWVTIAFGPFWGFQKGWLSFLSGIADNSLYPILLLDSLVALLQTNGEVSVFADGWPRIISIMTMVIVLTYLNYRGLDYVGNASIAICIFSMLPFIVFCLLGAGQVQPERWSVQPPEGWKGINWPLYLNTFFWNFNYWDSAASYSGDVHNPAKNYPIGLFYGFLLVSFSTFFPVLIGLGASSKPYTEWSDGYFTALAVEVGGPWLGIWMMAAGMVTNIGSFEAEMSSDSCQVAGMADRGILPKVLGRRSQYGTPTYGILMSASGVFCLCWLSFSQVVEMLNLLYCFAQLIEFAAFVQLRIKHPDMPRPFRIPLGTFGVSLMLLVPALFIFVMIGFSSVLSIVCAGFMCVLGFAMAHLLNIANDRGWCVFENQFVETCPSLINPFVETKARKEFLEQCLTSPVGTVGAKSFQLNADQDNVEGRERRNTYGTLPSNGHHVSVGKGNDDAHENVTELSSLLPSYDI